MIEIKLLVDKKVVIETLCRIGILNRKDKVLYPSSYLYEQDNKVYITHFKELFALTRSNSFNNMSEEDILRLKAIVWNLCNWKLVEAKAEDLEPHTKYIHVLPFKDKQNWNISHKFNTKLLYQATKVC